MSPEMIAALYAGARAPQAQQGRAKFVNGRYVLDGDQGTRGRGGTATSLISEGSAVAGGVVGGVIGSVIPVAGTAAGAAIGSGLGGFLGRMLENKVRDDRVGVGDAAKEGALSAVLSGPIKLGKYGLAATRAGMGGSGLTKALTTGALASDKKLAATLAQRTGGAAAANVAGDVTQAVGTDAAQTAGKMTTTGKLNNLGNKALQSQYGTITRPVAKSNKPLETINELANYGITKPADAERIAGAITGSNGILTKAVGTAVEGAGSVQTTGIKQLLDEAITTGGLVDSNAKSVKNIVNAQLKAIEAKGGTATATLQAMKSLEKRIADLGGKGGNYRNATPERLDQANVLGKVRDELENRLYTTAGANKNVAGVLTPQLRESLIALSPNNRKWAAYVDNTIMKSSDVKSLRSAQAPFVRIGNIIDDADINDMTFGGRMGNLANAGGIRATLANLVAQPVMAPAARAVSKPLRAVGSKAPQAAQSAVANTTASAAIQGGRRGAQGQLLESLMFPGAVQEQPVDQVPLDAPLDPNMVDPNLLDPTMTPSDSPFDPANMDANIQAILDQGGDLKDVKEYVGLVEALANLKGTGASAANKPVSAEAAKAITNAQTGLSALNDFENIIASDPSALTKTVIPGRDVLGGVVGRALGTQSLDAARQQVVDIIARLRTGAAITASEEARFKQFLPTAADTPEVAQQKLGYLRNQFQEVLNKVGVGTTPTLEEVGTTYGL